MVMAARGWLLGILAALVFALQAPAQSNPSQDLQPVSSWWQTVIWRIQTSLEVWFCLVFTGGRPWWAPSSSIAAAGCPSLPCLR